MTNVGLECRLLGVDRKSISGGWRSAFSHKQTLTAAQEQPHFCTLRHQRREPTMANESNIEGISDRIDFLLEVR